MKKINTDLPYYIGSYSINSLIEKIESVSEDAELSWNSFGGSVYAGQQFADFINNMENKLNANVTGIVASMGASLLPFFDHVKGAAQSDVMLHSASGGSGAKLKHTNEFLYNALAKKIDEEKFEKITGHKLKTVMLAEGDQRFNVWFTGKDAKKMGLYDQVYDLLDDKKNVLENGLPDEIGYEIPKNIAEKYSLKVEKKENNINIQKTDMEIKDVTKKELLSENAELHNSLIEEGSDQGTKNEQKRVADIMNYAKYDIDKANELIKSGNKLDIKDVEYFLEKKFNSKKIDDLENDSEEEIDAAKPTLNKEQTEKQAALNELDDITGVNEIVNQKTK